MTRRIKPTPRIEKEVLVASNRRCCLCYYLRGATEQRRGQLAHLQQDASSSGFDDLVWLCLEHHDEFDSRTRQSKNFTRQEVRHYRDRLYRELGTASGDLVQTPVVLGPKDLLREWYPASLVTVVEAAKGKLDYLAAAWRPVIWGDERLRLLFAYKSPNRFDGVCRIERIVLRDKRTVIICEQVSENPGMSITNAVEEIAFQVCGWYEIDPEQLVWIEHYPRETGYLRVSFTVQPPAGMFAGPSWIPMQRADWRDLGLRARGSDVSSE